MNIYVLELENGKYYVGKTSLKVEERFVQHLEGKGSTWASKYKPIKILKKIESEDPFDEDKHVFKYMSLKGINNVRGGTFSCEVLSEDEYYVLERIIRHAKGACLRCGYTNHLIFGCYAKRDINGEKLE